MSATSIPAAASEVTAQQMIDYRSNKQIYGRLCTKMAEILREKIFTVDLVKVPNANGAPAHFIIDHYEGSSETSQRIPKHALILTPGHRLIRLLNNMVLGGQMSSLFRDAVDILLDVSLLVDASTRLATPGGHFTLILRMINRKLEVTDGDETVEEIVGGDLSTTEMNDLLDPTVAALREDGGVNFQISLDEDTSTAIPFVVRASPEGQITRLVIYANCETTKAIGRRDVNAHSIHEILRILFGAARIAAGASMPTGYASRVYDLVEQVLA